MTTYKHINLSYLDLMADGDLDMKKTMLALLLEEPLEEIKKMTVLANEKQWHELKAVSHKMKSTLAFVGNDLLTNTNRSIEHFAQSFTELDKIPQLVEVFHQQFLLALDELKQEYENCMHYN